MSRGAGFDLGTLAAALSAAIALLPATALAQTFPEFESQWRNPAAGRVDPRSGRPDDGPNDRPNDFWDPAKPAGLGQEAPLRPEYRAIFEASLKDQAAGGRGNNYQAACVLDGMPRLMSLTAPMEVLIQPGLVFFIFQNAFTRRIHTDGAPMPADEPASFQGYSIGRWIDEDGDGRYDAFEIETRNFKGPRALDSTGLPLHRDNQTVVRERLTLDKANRDLLHNEVTTIDHAFTRPWTVRKTYVRERNPRWAEYSCRPPADAAFIGLTEYRLSADGKLMPMREGQPPPDLRYFGPRK